MLSAGRALDTTVHDVPPVPQAYRLFPNPPGRLHHEEHDEHQGEEEPRGDKLPACQPAVPAAQRRERINQQPHVVCGVFLPSVAPGTRSVSKRAPEARMMSTDFTDYRRFEFVVSNAGS